MAVPLFDQAVLNRDLDGLGAIPGLQLFEHRGDVVLDGSLGDEQVNGDLAVAHPRDEAVQHSGLARREFTAAPGPRRSCFRPTRAITFDAIAGSR
jgi:hypothetical protein